MGLNIEKEIVLETLHSVFKKYVCLNSASNGRPLLQYVFRKVYWKIEFGCGLQATENAWDGGIPR
jgi:hypothetical protein